MAHLAEELDRWEGRYESSGEEVGGEENQTENAFSFCIRSMNGTSYRKTCQVGGEAQCAILLFK